MRRYTRFPIVFGSLFVMQSYCMDIIPIEVLVESEENAIDQDTFARALDEAQSADVIMDMICSRLLNGNTAFRQKFFPNGLEDVAVDFKELKSQFMQSLNDAFEELSDKACGRNELQSDIRALKALLLSFDTAFDQLEAALASLSMGAITELKLEEYERTVQRIASLFQCIITVKDIMVSKLAYVVGKKVPVEVSQTLSEGQMNIVVKISRGLIGSKLALLRLLRKAYRAGEKMRATSLKKEINSIRLTTTLLTHQMALLVQTIEQKYKYYLADEETEPLLGDLETLLAQANKAADINLAELQTAKTVL
jgi:hypothetical protein